MKSIIGLLFITFSIASNGQSLFFNNVKGSQWYRAELFKDSITFSKKEIDLATIKGIGTLPPTFDLWEFEDDKLHIWRYDSTLKALSTVRLLRYEIIQEKGKEYVRIYPSYRDEYVEYEVGIISTGNFVLLIKRKKKKK